MKQTLTATETGFLRNGAEHTIISGALHYFRVQPQQWRDRLRRLVAMGCNTVETYVAWNWHAPSEGRVSFTGPADLGRFLDIAAQEGLDAIVRPGPYICAEWENGGFPGWLLRDRNMRLRCMDERYLKAVDSWFGRLIPIIAQRQACRGGNVVMVQVENEYGSYGDDRAYLQHLRNLLLRLGIEEMLVTSDGPGRGWLSGGTVDGALATINFGSRAREYVTMAETELPGQPLMCMEFWNGWFDHWGEQHTTRSPESAAAELADMLDAGMSVNFYMAHGGSNTQLYAGANHNGTLQPTVTSYDYDAPIAENGALTPKFHAFRQVISRYRELPQLDSELTRLGLAENPKTLPAQELPLGPAVSLSSLACWRDREKTYPQVPAFEDIGLERGAYLLRRELELVVHEGEYAPLVLHGLADRALVLIDGKPVADVSGRAGGPVAVPLAGIWDGAPVPRSVLLEVWVESEGRVNFGRHLGSRKGVLGGIWHGYRFLNNVGVSAFPLPDMGEELESQAKNSAYAEAGESPLPGEPVLASATLHCKDVADAYVDTAGLGRGFLYVNGYLLGRYSDEGPQRTLYLPAPLLHEGDNTLTVLETTRAAGLRLALSERPLLGSEREEGNPGGLG
ncbi:glycoside hydrolase family 35 protein [Dermabacteraceae bacterium P7054]